MKDYLPDIQSQLDVRKIDITRVGLRGLAIPMRIQAETGDQPTVATFSMSVALPATHRGTHMSRFVAMVNETREALSPRMLSNLLSQMLESLESDAGTIEVSCPFFVMKTSPVSRLQSWMNYDVRFVADRSGNATTIRQETSVPVASLCPCSREISDYGAHNQRSKIIVAIECEEEYLSLEEQIRLVETCASCELWGRLKRSDEKYVTEYAYDHPKFVEDAARECASKLNADLRVSNIPRRGRKL